MADAIIFDCDGVLVDSEILAMRGERSALIEMGLVYDEQDYLLRYTGMHDDAFYEAIRLALVEHLGAAPEGYKETLMAARSAQMKDLTVIAEARDALQATLEKGFGLGVASSSRTQYLENKMRLFDLWDVAAPHVYSADLVEQAKPAPDVFLYTAEKMGVLPEKCIAIEDSENGVRAGIAAGMEVWGFLGGGHIFDGHGERLMQAGAARLVRNHNEIIDLLG